ncbi:hypothetical protein [Caenimonas aquaedulcis]|uniref:DUF2782 domain-containing protein n=1 Tax=Caenimonas aquaedulcis TaxID=2793270 RepID=A0A931H847_9BURK|nr:hypothetical protein [Caenimonas aquaedulcis]MBG9390371.1 hypothetical protein [Caenimonas aquaedulcis]
MLSRLLLTVLLGGFAALAQAQTAPAGPATAAAVPPPALVQDPTPADGRRNQRVERIHVEDSRVVIDETRYAGQTEKIRVKPKNGAPAYEVQPGGARVWNVLDF